MSVACKSPYTKLASGVWMCPYMTLKLPLHALHNFTKVVLSFAVKPVYAARKCLTTGTSALSIERHTLLLRLLRLLLDALHGSVGRSKELLALGVATALLVPLVRP